MRLHRGRVAVAVAIALVLVVAACSSGKKDAAKPTTTTAAPTTTVAPLIAPLLGTVTTDGAIAKRPALVVKIDNADGVGPGARPQLGLNQADVVYEEMVEGSVTRLAAIFQSQVPDLVGPVRSARATDVAVVSPLDHPLYAWSGGNIPTIAIVHAAPLRDVGVDAHPGAYRRRNQGGHVAPHNLYTSPPALFALAPADAGPPPPLFQYRPAGTSVAQATAPAVQSIHLVFGHGPGSAPVDWRWDATHSVFTRSQHGTPHVDEAGVQITAPNVVVMFVSYGNTGLTDIAGNAVPQAKLEGTGGCWILTDGRLITGTWSKSGPAAVPTFVDGAGAPIQLTPGHTWVELAPPGAGTHTP